MSKVRDKSSCWASGFEDERGIETKNAGKQQQQQQQPLKSESESSSVALDSFPPPWTLPGQNTAVGSLSLLQGTCPNQRLNLGLLHCRQILYQLSHKGSPGLYICFIYVCACVCVCVYTKGTFHAKMGTIKDRNGTDLTEAEDIKKRWQEYTELHKKWSSWPR